MTAQARPVPTPSAETAPFWEGAARGVLCLPACGRCGTLFFPPGARCPHCLSDQVIWRELSGRGRLRSWTELFIPAYPGSPLPTVVAEVEPDENRAIVLPMLAAGGTERLVMGGPVAIRFEADANGWSFPVAEPDPASDRADGAGVATGAATHER